MNRIDMIRDNPILSILSILFILSAPFPHARSAGTTFALVTS